jgi:hypothetical protein
LRSPPPGILVQGEHPGILVQGELCCFAEGGSSFGLSVDLKNHMPLDRHEEASSLLPCRLLNGAHDDGMAGGLVGLLLATSVVLKLPH